MKLSEGSRALIAAYNKGYRVIDGKITARKKSPRGYIQVQLKGSIDSDGYHQFSFRHLGKKKNIFVHRLVAFQKYGREMFEDGIEARHLNGIKSDNSDLNVEIGTTSENHFDIPKHMRVEKARKAGIANAIMRRSIVTAG